MEFQSSQGRGGNFYATAVGAGLAAPASTVSGVPTAMGHLETQIGALAHHVSEVITRLESCGVLKMAGPQAGQSGGPLPPAYQSSLANMVDNLRAQVAALTSAVVDVQERLDI